jgi:probable F420-dependent oxidoreductase
MLGIGRLSIGVAQLVDGTPGRGLEFVQQMAVALEDLGFASFWAPDHIVLFDEHVSAYPYSHDGRFPFPAEQGFLETSLVLLAAASVTTRLRIGTGVEILPLRNPVVRAKEIATLDVLSGGRFDYGIGVGWLREEFDAIGVPFEGRGRRANEMIEAMKALWTQERSAFHGDVFHFTDVSAWPKPVQQPHPPIIVGGNSQAAFRRAARTGDGWYGLGISPLDVPGRLAELDAALARHGRSRGDGFRVVLVTGPVADAADLVAYAKAVAPLGVDEVVLGPPLSRRRYRAQLEELAVLFGG